LSHESGIPRVMEGQGEGPPALMESRVTAEAWQRVKDIAADALERPSDQHAAFVLSQCDGDRALAAEILAIVEASLAADSCFESPAGFTSAAAAEPGMRVASWKLVRLLGQGGMASVYLAERSEAGFDQRAAVKIVRGGYADGFLAQRFLDERRILASLEHPNIARFIDGGTTAYGVPYVALEYVEGVRIDEFCDARRLNTRERIAVFRQVCSAVEYAHRRLVVHRDIKASNILVAHDGTPKLLDFGIAKLIDPTLVQDRTHTLFRVVTPESASPEQLRGEPVTTATDVYSLGVLLYRLLTGLSPYGSGPMTEADLVKAVCTQTAVPPSRLMRQTTARTTSRLRQWRTDDLDHIVMKALRKEPERRYGSVDQFSNDLRRYLDGLPVDAAPDSVTYRCRKFVNRHRRAVGAAVASVVLLLAAVATVAWQARVAQRERTRAQAQFDAVRSLANALMGDVHAAIVKLPGSVSAQAVLLKHATEYLDRLLPQAEGDASLRRELAVGYIRLAQMQGLPAMSNLGDKDAARASYTKAARLLEGLLGESRDAVRFQLGETYVRLGALTDDTAAKTAWYLRAVPLVKDPPADARTLGIVQALWAELGQVQITSDLYDDALQSSREASAAAEAAYKLAPHDLSVSRNLSLALKTSGSLLARRRQFAEAIAQYTKALELDRARVARDDRPLWKLDLSFSLASIGGARADAGDLAGGLTIYREALRLRELAAKQDPDDDFMKTSLARGYGRLAQLLTRAQDADGVIAALEQQLDVLRGRITAHPERPNVWHEYASAAFSAIRMTAEVLEPRDGAAPSAARRALRTMLEDLRVRRDAWRAANRDAWPLGEDDNAFSDLSARVKKLM
jgi:tetratricopeptide (TPR) repeat protein